MMDISNVPELINDEGYPLMLDTYDATPRVYPLFADVRQLTADIIYGAKGDVLTTMGDLEDRADGEEFEADEFRSGPTWYMKVQQWGRRLDIPERMVMAADARGRIANLVREQMGSWGASSALKKDNWVADVLQQGTLTAGNRKYFDGSFPGNADPYPKFIYDGLPFFDTAHTQTIGSSTYSNHSVSLALTKANYETVRRTMRVTNAFDERGREILIMPDTILVPPDLTETARTIIESQLLPGTAQNDINTARGTAQIIENRFLSDDSDAWWVCQRGQGLRVYDEGPPRMYTVWNESRRKWELQVETRFGVVVTNWRYWYNANKAAA